MRNGMGLWIALAAASCLPQSAAADTVYSNLGTGGNVYSAITSWTVSGAGSDVAALLQPAFSFTSPGNFTSPNWI